MDASLKTLSSLHSIPGLKTPRSISNFPTICYAPNLPSYKPPIRLNTNMASTSRSISVVNGDISAIAIDPTQADITWQILIGALAGVIPFVVAAIEFSKRIVEQRNCKVCKGSGLVLRDGKYYFRCPRCGGFLPWQSWRRFFTVVEKQAEGNWNIQVNAQNIGFDCGAKANGRIQIYQAFDEGAAWSFGRSSNHEVYQVVQ